jgi:hypothetical protein
LFELRHAGEPMTWKPQALPEDRVALLHYARELVGTPLNRAAVRRALEHTTASAPRLDESTIAEQFARALADGTLELGRVGEELPMGSDAHSDASAGDGKSGQAASAKEPTRPRTEEKKIRDWRLECSHHAAGKRALFQKGTVIQLVPDKGKTKDKVKLWWKDEPLGSLPDELPVGVPVPKGKQLPKAPLESGGGDTGTFALDAEFFGELNNVAFPLPAFWRAWREPTVYSLGPGPTTVRVDVFNPRHFKLELSMPPLSGFKTGSKFEADTLDPAVLRNRSALTEKLTVEESGWTPSTLQVKSYRTATHPEPDFKATESESSLGGIKLTRDDTEVEIEALKVIGSILEASATLRDLVTAIKKFKDFAPSIGWYIDFGAQFFQGGIAVEWYWKEHTDHQVFTYYDFNVSLKIFSIEFELGLGVGAFGFRLQIFAQLAGELVVEGGAKHEKPEGRLGFNFPAAKGKVTGALGARFEAGAFFKFEAKGETGIELELTVGVNQRDKPFIFDFRARWTGISCTATGSVGLFGIGGKKTWTSVLVPESRWIGLTLPAEKEYVPPFLSRDRIAQIVLGVITDGWDVRVIRGSGAWYKRDHRWPPEEIAGVIADRIDADPLVDRTNDSIDGLAHAIRKDLDQLGVRTGRDYIEEPTFRQYVAGPGMAARLSAAHSAERQLLKANGK